MGEGGWGGEGEEGEGVGILPVCRAVERLHAKGSEETSETKEDKERSVETSEGQLACLLAAIAAQAAVDGVLHSKQAESQSVSKPGKQLLHSARKTMKTLQLRPLLARRVDAFTLYRWTKGQPEPKGGTSQYRLEEEERRRVRVEKARKRRKVE